jgi:hypothetical protein
MARLAGARNGHKSGVIRPRARHRRTPHAPRPDRSPAPPDSDMPPAPTPHHAPTREHVRQRRIALPAVVALPTGVCPTQRLQRNPIHRDTRHMRSGLGTITSHNRSASRPGGPSGARPPPPWRSRRAIVTIQRWLPPKPWRVPDSWLSLAFARVLVPSAVAERIRGELEAGFIAARHLRSRSAACSASARS